MERVQVKNRNMFSFGLDNELKVVSYNDKFVFVFLETVCLRRQVNFGFWTAVLLGNTTTVL